MWQTRACNRLMSSRNQGAVALLPAAEVFRFTDGHQSIGACPPFLDKSLSRSSAYVLKTLLIAYESYDDSCQHHKSGGTEAALIIDFFLAKLPWRSRVQSLINGTIFLPLASLTLVSRQYPHNLPRPSFTIYGITIHRPSSYKF